MRLKNIPEAAGAIEKSSHCLTEGTSKRGQWKEVFLNDNPIEIEIGMGKGQFIIGMAKADPEKNFIGIERYTSVIYRAVQKLEAMESDGISRPLPNLMLLCEDAANLTEFFAPEEISGIYLNFSDPWPKDRHAKRRLTHRRFLKMYHDLLPEGGKLQLKTDNDDLFAFSTEEIGETDFFDIEEIVEDIYRNGPPEGNIPTEYEEKFAGLGQEIHRLSAVRRG